MHNLGHLMRKKAYRTFFFSFVLMFLLPVLVLVWVMNWSAANIRQEAGTSNRLILEQLINGIDGQLYTVSRLAESMLVDDKALFFAERDDPMRYLDNITSFQMLRSLTQEVGIMPSAYPDIELGYLYFPRNGKVITNTITDAKDFHARKLAQQFDSPQAWIDFLAAQPNGFFNRGAVMYLSTLKRGDSPLITVLIALKPTVFDRYQTVFEGDSALEASIFSARGEPLFFAGGEHPELLDLAEAVSGAAMPLDGDWVLEGGPVALRVYWRQSADTGCIYMISLPEAVFQGPARALILSLGLGIVLLLGAGILLSLLLARRQYQPILALRDFIDQNAKHPQDSKGDDFEYLAEMIRAMDAEARQANQEIRLTQRQMEQFALERLLKGMYGAQEEMEAQLLSLNLAFATDLYLVIGARINGFAEGSQELRMEDRQLMRFVVCNVLEELLEAYDAHSTVIDGIIWVICALPEDPSWEQVVADKLTEGLAFLRERFQFEMTMVAGHGVQGMEGIAHGYREAVQLLRRAEQGQRSFCLGYQEGPGENRADDGPPVATVARQLAQRLSEGDFPLAECLLREFNAQTLSLRPTLARLAWHSLLQGILTLIHVEGDREAELTRRMDALLEVREPGAEYPAMVALCRVLARNPHREDSGKGTEIAQRVRELIEGQYADPSMNISQIAEQLGLTASYASSLYKRQAGESMLDTINQVRLTHAKALLLDEGLTVEEIAIRVGYYSHSTFLRAFKKQEGITPGQWRALGGRP